MDHRVTRQQKRMMLQLMREAMGMSERKEKDEHWEKCQNMLNKIGPPRKTLIQWKKIWRDMRCTTKKKLIEIKRTRPGSPCPVVLTKEDHEIIEIVGAGSDYFEEVGDAAEAMNEDNISLAELAKSKPGLLDKEPLDEPAIEPIQPRKIKFILPPPPPPEAEHFARKVMYNSNRGANSFGMDDKVLATLLESIAEASKANREKRELPDPDKLFLLSFVDTLKTFPQAYKFEIKTDILNIFRKWHEKISYEAQRAQVPTSSHDLHPINNLEQQPQQQPQQQQEHQEHHQQQQEHHHQQQHSHSNIQHPNLQPEHQTHSSNHSGMNQENGNVQF